MCVGMLLRLMPIFAVLALAPAAYVLAADSGEIRVQIVDERGMPVRDAVVEMAHDQAHRGTIRFPWRMAIAQRNEAFVPDTLVIARGSTVAFPNLDKVRHSIYSFSKPARFEIELYGRDQTRSHTFPLTGTVALGCNIHDNMRGYLRVVDTPFAGKTDANGYVTLDGLPTGNISATIWHPDLRAPNNEKTGSIPVKAGQNARRIAVNLR